MNFTSQIGTNIEQSEKLITLGLKKETADMCINPSRGLVYPFSYSEALSLYNNYGLGKIMEIDLLFPAWSLHRLLYLIPNEYFTDVDFQNVMQRCIFATSTLYDDLIDLIEALIKEEYFYKEYLEE